MERHARIAVMEQDAPLGRGNAGIIGPGMDDADRRKFAASSPPVACAPGLDLPGRPCCCCPVGAWRSAQGVPFLTLFSAVTLSAFFGGWVVGLFATVVGGVAAVYFLILPTGSFAIGTASDALALAGYAVTCSVIVLIIHIAIRVAEANVALAAQRQVLLMELQHRIKNHLQLLGAMIATHATP